MYLFDTLQWNESVSNNRIKLYFFSKNFGKVWKNFKIFSWKFEKQMWGVYLLVADWDTLISAMVQVTSNWFPRWSLSKVGLASPPIAQNSKTSEI